MINVDTIRAAGRKIAPLIHRTPLIQSHSFSVMSGANVYIKAENLQKTGSFKVRGACNAMLLTKGDRVIAASMGNHAQGVAYAARKTGKSARIVMPVTAPLVKQEATRGYGAEVELYGETFDEALRHALSQKGFTFIHAFDDLDVIAGQGTIGQEITDEMDDIDVIIVPVGGGGLISGLSVWVKGVAPRIKIIGAQSVSASSAVASFRKEDAVPVETSSTLADGISVGRVGETTLPLINKYVDDMLTVSEDSIAMAVLMFMERKKLVVEGAGAVPLALLMEHKERFANKKVVLLVSGGNIDFSVIDRIIQKGLMSSGRIGLFGVVVDDVPGRLHALTGIIASNRGNILHVNHDRLSPDLPVGRTKVFFTVETRGKQHQDEIMEDIIKNGFEVTNPAG